MKRINENLLIYYHENIKTQKNLKILFTDKEIHNLILFNK